MGNTPTYVILDGTFSLVFCSGNTFESYLDLNLEHCSHILFLSLHVQDRLPCCLASEMTGRRVNSTYFRHLTANIRHRDAAKLIREPES
jgi:hypothetical protein